MEICAWSAAVAVPMIAIVRFLAGPSDVAGDIGLGYREPGWPRGVQEEEPVPWRLEFLRRPRPEESIDPSRRRDDASRRRDDAARRCELAPSAGR
jgi:hypothetical protein